ncbi:hypothetical protein D0Y65_023035 [Glycine soja]|uniref:BTB domain-containing protein n=1 Tax=Glycine soja TaxID=3848 RepID=A0A445IWD7_GLYSO|nr:hypothetical protein D0Y65_023035 [Glycine soja]
MNEREIEDTVGKEIFHHTPYSIKYIYTGTVNVNLDIAEDLWRAADQYLLDHLKSICEYAILLLL